MSEPVINELISSTVNNEAGDKNPKNLSLESLALLIMADRLHNLENQLRKEFVEVKKRQDQVTLLHKLIKMINMATVDEKFDCSNDPELQDLLAKAKESGVEIEEGKFKYEKEERDRLIENIRMTADDYSVLNDMQLQTVSRLTTERYEAYQMARTIMRPLHEDKQNKARAMAGK
jgi:hypothetical protein